MGSDAAAFVDAEPWQRATAGSPCGEAMAAAGLGSGGGAVAMGSGVVGDVQPTRMMRAKEWNVEVENAYRLQEAGYRDETEATALGHPPVERWPDLGFVRKLVTKETVTSATPSTIYFSKKRECQDKDLPKVKLFMYS